MNLRDIVLRNARLHSEKTAVVFNERRVSHAQFAARGFRLANALLSLGLRRQERVAVLAPNCLEYLEAFCACECAGLVIVNLNHRLAPRELVQIGQDCEPAVLIFHSQFREAADALATKASGLRHAICIDERIVGIGNYEELIATASPSKPDVPL